MATRGRPTMEEAIRLVLETEGREGIDGLRDALSQMGDVSAETQAETSGLIDNLVQLNETAAKAARYGELTRELERSQTALDQASQSAYQLTLELGNTEKPSRELVRAQKAARDEVERLEGAVTKQWQALERADAELGSLGVNTADYQQAQSALRTSIGRTTTAVAEQVAVVQKQATAQRQLRERLAEGDDKFRRFAQSGTAAAESLEAYRGRAAAARDETARVAKEAEGAGGVFGRLRGVVAGVFGFFSARSLIGGLRSIVTEGSNAEQELGQLNSVLASTGRESEFAAGELQKLADRLASTSNFASGDIINAQTRLLSYTNILRSEFPDAMQIVIDQSARLGISLEQSAEIVGRSLQEPTKAMQALGRQGFVLEESQKTLLAQLEATGRTAEAQRIIMDLLVESYGGAATAQKVGTIAGLWKSVAESFRDFQQDIANRGVLDYFKGQLSELLNTTARLQRDGTLGRWAQQIADGIVRMAASARNAALQLAPLVKIVGDAAAVFARNAEAVFLLGKAYVGLKLVQLATQYAALTSAKLANLAATRALTGATVAQGAATLTLGERLRALPTQLRIGVAVLGVDWAIRQMGELKATIADMDNAERQVEAWGRSQRSLQAENLRLGRQLQELYKANADIAIQSAEEINALGREDAENYRYRLNEAAKYYEGVVREARGAGDAMRAAAAQDQWRLVLSTLDQVETKLRNNGISTGARAIATELRGIDKSARTAGTELGKLFDNLDFNDTVALRDVAVAVSDIGGRSASAAKNVTEGLEAALARLSGEELLKLQTNATAAFATFEEAPRGAAVVLDTVLLTAMRRLGVASSQWGVEVTTAGADAIASFTTVAEAANSSSAQIEAAFKAALNLAQTEAEAKALGAALLAAGEQGKIGFDASERAASALRARVGEIQNAVDPLNDSFRRLGITSKAELDRAAAAAKDAFHDIRQAAGRGEAAIEDVRAAAQRYGEAMRAAAANSDASSRARVEAEIRVMEAVFGVKESLDTMGVSGAEAGRNTADGANLAADALRRLREEAGGAGDNVEQVGGEAGKAGEQVKNLEKSTDAAAIAFGNMSKEAINALSAANRLVASPRLWIMEMNRTLSQISEERKAVDSLTRSYEAQTEALTPQIAQLAELRQSYKFATDEQLRGLAAAKAAFQERRAQIRAEAESRREARRQAAIEAAGGEGAAGRSGAAAGTRSLGRLEIVMPEGETRALLTDQDGAELVAEMLQQLARSRSTSQLRRRS
ncbi:phage tail length tape measure family protein [Luteimonas sp BLCC-B24]|uniref:phage tail length tape measure family protein n=1 Tax=Luteimonas sp. BLCC-B24 TaxID=3025317 RepID=UPI00234DA820|nr:phage tail length tape measure family protein [Luteimonas sp. BLCC-B24]MDC7806427.1 phage tail length tape measure family protein [Luteimonas sp. BLCC-B24]